MEIRKICKKNNPQKICLVGLPVAWPVRAEKLKQEALEQLAQTHNKLKQTNRKTNNWKTIKIQENRKTYN